MKRLIVALMSLLVAGLTAADTAATKAEYGKVVNNKLKQWDHIITQLESNRKNDGRRIRADADIDRSEILSELKGQKAAIHAALKDLERASDVGWHDVQKRIEPRFDKMESAYRKVAAE